MPLKKGKSQKTISKNIKEMNDNPGPHFKDRIAKAGKKQAQREMVAAAERKAGKSRAPAKKDQHGSNRKKRNIGRH